MKIYDYAGNEMMGDIVTDKTMTLDGVPADAKAVGTFLEEAGIETVEPGSGDIPCVYITGTLPTTKEQGKAPVTLEYISKSNRFKSYATLKVQGSSSTGFPKKNFTLQLYSNAERTTKDKRNFRGWGAQSKFVLKANWIDITHARNIVCARLWGDMARTRTDFAQYPEGFRNAPNQGAIDGFVVRVFVNGVYHGRYTWNIPKDKWTFAMTENDTSAILCSGDIHSTAWMDGPITLDGGDNWEDELHEDAPLQSTADRFNAFISFITSSSDADFVAGLSNYAYISSLVDYYIMLYIFCAADNCGKNQIYVTYDGSPYIASAYDMDCVYGMDASGDVNDERATDPYPNTAWGKNNLLYKRLSDLFMPAIKSRYADLRANVLSDASINNRFEVFFQGQSAELIAEDYAETTADGAYTGIPSRNKTSLQQIRGFVAKRMDYVDSVLLS